MTNVYLEKIALSINDVRDARNKANEASSNIQSKGMGPGLLAGAAIGAVLGRRQASKLVSGLKSQGINERNLKNIKDKFTVEGGMYGGLVGTAAGGLAMNGRARREHNKVYADRINKGLAKSAEVTPEQVSKRTDRSARIAGTSAVAGSMAGMVAGVGSVIAGPAHRAMRDNQGYGAIKDSLKNAYSRRKANKEIKVGKGSFYTPLKDIKPSRAVAKYVDKSGVARGVGNAVGMAVQKRGLIGAAVGTLVGGVGAGAIAQHAVDKSDVKYYKKLHKASQNV